MKKKVILLTITVYTLFVQYIWSCDTCGFPNFAQFLLMHNFIIVYSFICVLYLNRANVQFFTFRIKFLKSHAARWLFMHLIIYKIMNSLLLEVSKKLAFLIILVVRLCIARIIFP